MPLTETSEVAAGEIDPDGRIGALIEQGHTLPSEWYTSERLFELEQKRIFRLAWEYVGHRGQVQVPGDYFSCEVGGVPIVIVCGRDTVVRAFYNICRHRHHTVALGAGNRPLLQCNYHAWTYKLDGSFNGAPRSREDENFDGSSLCLKSASVGFLGDMVFVNPASDARPLQEVLGPIPALATEKGLPLRDAVFRQTRIVEFEANWKIAYDNNCECYHCPTIHTSWYKKARLDKNHVYSYPIGPLHFEVVMDQHDDALADSSFYCWPAICITSSGGAGKVEGLDGSDIAAGHPGYFCWRFVPVSARKTRIELSVFSLDDLTEAQLDAWFETILSVVNEDRDVCERVQRSHDSGAGELGNLIPAIDSEYHTLVWERLLHRALTSPQTDLYAPILEPSGTWPDQ